MNDPQLSVVVPVFNEARHLPATLLALVDAVDRSPFEAEVVIVDDGSTDGSAAVARDALPPRLRAKVVRQANRGRFVARQAGLEAATAELALLLDGRVRLEPDALTFVHERLTRGERVWSAHVHVDAEHPLGLFWRLLAELAWREYFDDPRTTSFGAAEFDRFPKGTTCFLAPRSLLLQAFAGFTSRYADLRSANDDTPLLRALAAVEPINISPGFACSYTPREDLRAFLRHGVHRGVVFLDGHGTPASRFYPVAAAFFPLSAALLTASLRRPWVLPAAACACGLGAAAYGARAGRSAAELRALALVTPLYALAHGLGMWKGLGSMLRARLAG